MVNQTCHHLHHSLHLSTKEPIIDMMKHCFFASFAALLSSVEGWVMPSASVSRGNSALKLSAIPPEIAASPGNLHGEAACFMPLEQNDEEFFAPRIVQVRRLMKILLCLKRFTRNVLWKGGFYVNYIFDHFPFSLSKLKFEIENCIINTIETNVHVDCRIVPRTYKGRTSSSILRTSCRKWTMDIRFL